MKNGWELRTLGDLFDITSSKRVFESDWKRQGVPFYRAREIVKLAQQGFVDNELFISEEMFSRYSSKYGIPAEGDIMVTGVGTLGICYVVQKDDRFYFKDGNIIWLKKKSEVDSRFVEYAFKSDFLRKQIDDSVGATVGTYTIVKAKNTKIPVPPLPEQQRIVGILDEAFEGIATAKAKAEKNLQSARALFESYLQSVFTRRGPGWVEKTLEDVCIKITDGTHHSPQKQFSEPGSGRFPYITSKNIRNNYMDLSNVAYIERAFHDEVYARCQPSVGDVLLTKDGASTGNVTLNTLDEPFSLLSSVCLIKTNRTVLRPAFLCYYLQSSTGLSSIVGQMTGAAIKRIVLKEIKKAAIPFPPLKDQDSIVKTLDALLAETQRLTTIYEQKLAALDALKKSLLHQAFTGNL
jgi:type I restriction enzyme S subunit